jgi:MoaA/NifB/PqqE/SkfB family radical SAM enzyme
MLKTLWKKIFQDSPGKRFSAWQVELTTRCPLECRMCSRTAYKDFFRKDMALDDFKRLLPYFSQVESVVLEGWGESLLHRDLVECLRLAKNAGPRVGFVTSGKGLSDPLISEVLGAGVDFMGFSISGATPKTHNFIRVNSDLDDMLNRIRVLQEMKARKNLLDPQLHIVYLLLKENVAEVPALIELARDLGITEVVLIHLCHVGNAWQEEQRIFSQNGREDFEKVLKEAEEKAREWKIDLQRPPLSFGEAPVCAENPLRNLYISVEGEVSPCVYLNPPVPSPFKRIFQGREVQVEKVNFGNVFQEPFDRIWENPEYVEFRDRFARRKAHFKEMFASLWEPDRSKGLEVASPPAPPGPCQTCYKMLRL